MPTPKVTRRARVAARREAARTNAGDNGNGDGGRKDAPPTRENWFGRHPVLSGFLSVMFVFLLLGSCSKSEEATPVGVDAEAIAAVSTEVASLRADMDVLERALVEPTPEPTDTPEPTATPCGPFTYPGCEPGAALGEATPAPCDPPAVYSEELTHCVNPDGSLPCEDGHYESGGLCIPNGYATPGPDGLAHPLEPDAIDIAAKCKVVTDKMRAINTDFDPDGELPSQAMLRSLGSVNDGVCDAPIGATAQEVCVRVEVEVNDILARNEDENVLSLDQLAMLREVVAEVCGS